MECDYYHRYRESEIGGYSVEFQNYRVQATNQPTNNKIMKSTHHGDIWTPVSVATLFSIAKKKTSLCIHPCTEGFLVIPLGILSSLCT